MYKKLCCERHRYIFYGILKLEVTFNIISILLLYMDEYVYTSSLISKKCCFWINIISFICANERTHLQLNVKSYMEDYPSCKGVTMLNRWNNRISDGCLYAQIRKGLGMHLVTYSNHDTVPFLLIVPIKGRFVWDGIHCVYIYQRLHDFLTLIEYLGNLVHFSIYKGWNLPFLLGDILNIPLKGSI